MRTKDITPTIKHIIDERNKQEKTLLDKAFLESKEAPSKSKTRYTVAIFPAKEVNKIVLMTHGFLVSREESNALAQTISNAEPNTLVIQYATDGLMTLTPEELDALFQFPEGHELDPKTQLTPQINFTNFYRGVRQTCVDHDIPLYLHGTSYGAQLILNAVIDTKLAPPERISLYAPFCQFTSNLRDTTWLALLSTYDDYCETIHKFQSRYFELFANVLIRLVAEEGTSLARGILTLPKKRQIDNLCDLPLETFMRFCKATTMFEQKVCANGGLSQELRERVFVVTDERDPISVDSHLFVATHLVANPEAQIQMSSAGKHVEDFKKESSSKVIKYIEASDLWGDETHTEKTSTTILDMILHHLGVEVKIDPTLQYDSTIPTP